MYGFKSYFWFAFKMWLVYSLVGSIHQSLAEHCLVLWAGIDVNVWLMLVAGWFFWRSHFSLQIEQEQRNRRKPKTIETKFKEVAEKKETE